jgi:hypothetical protein
MTKLHVNETFSIEMNKEHLSQSLQQYLRTYGYLKDDDCYFDVTQVNFLKGGDKVEIKGDVNVG